MLGAIVSTIAPVIVDKVMATIGKALGARTDKARIEADVKIAVTQALAETEGEWAKAAAASYGHFMAAATQSRVLVFGWLLIVVTQLGVLLWHQIGIPLYVHLTGQGWPSSGATADWGYLLLGAAIGAGPLILSRLKAVDGK